MQNVLMYKKKTLYKITSIYPPRCLKNNINTSRLLSLCRPQRNDCSKIPKYSLYLVMVWIRAPVSSGMEIATIYVQYINKI